MTGIEALRKVIKYSNKKGKHNTSEALSKLLHLLETKQIIKVRWCETCHYFRPKASYVENCGACVLYSRGKTRKGYCNGGGR